MTDAAVRDKSGSKDKRSFSTDRELKALKPIGKWYDVKDENTPGLSVRVGPLNSREQFARTFVYITRYPGSPNPARRAMGEYGPDSGGLSLTEAREKASQWRKLIEHGYHPREAEGREAEWVELIRKGVDPRDTVRARQAEVTAEEQRRSNTFGTVIEDYLKSRKKNRRAADDEREIRNWIVPQWCDKPVSEITRQDVRKLVKAIADRPAPYLAHGVFGHIRTFFNWAIDSGAYGLETSPCDRLKPAKLIGPKEARQRVLNDDELLAYWRAARRLPYPFGPMFRMLLLTGQRKSEVSDARLREFPPDLVRLLRQHDEDEQPIEWRKVDASRKLWTVPPERFKSDATHLVPLTDDVCQILEDMPRFKRGDYLFSTTFGEKPISGFSKAKARLDRHMLRTLKALARVRGEDPKDVELTPFVIHDLRRTMRTRLASLKVPDVVAEMIIGHGRKGIQRVYDQHKYIDEMREALELWAGRLRDITQPAPENVVAFAGARAAK